VKSIFYWCAIVGCLRKQNICRIIRTDDALTAMFSAPLFADYCTTSSEEIRHYSAFICQRVHFRCNWWDEKRTKNL